MREQKFRKKVERALGRPFTDEEWQYLVEKEHVQFALEEEDADPNAGVEYLLDIIRDLRSSPFGQRKQRAPQRRIEILDDAFSEAYNAIALQFAQEDRDIQDFRQMVLRGKLLSPEQVVEWLFLRLKYNRPLLPPDDSAYGLFQEFRILVKREHFPKDKIRLEELKCPSSGLGFSSSWVGPDVVEVFVRFPEFGTLSWQLSWLKWIAEKYAGVWYEPDVVNFVLTGEAPRIRTEAYSEGDDFSVPRICLRVPWYTSARTVVRVYRNIQKKYVGKNKLQLSKKHFYLLLFWKKREEKHSWRRLMQEWNIAYPEWSYNDPRNFSRDLKRVVWDLGMWEQPVSRMGFLENCLADFNYLVEQGRIAKGIKTIFEDLEEHSNEQEGESHGPAGEP